MKGKPIITKVEVYQFQYELKEIGVAGVSPKGMIPTYMPGSTLVRKSYAVRIHTDVGLVGEYAPCEDDISGYAAFLIGKNALERELIYHEVKSPFRGGLGGGA